MSALRGIVLTIWFVCELALVAALGYWGFEAGWPAPSASALIEFALFSAAVVGLVAAGQPLLGAFLGRRGLRYISSERRNRKRRNPACSDAPVIGRRGPRPSRDRAGES